MAYRKWDVGVKVGENPFPSPIKVDFPVSGELLNFDEASPAGGPPPKPPKSTADDGSI